MVIFRHAIWLAPIHAGYRAGLCGAKVPVRAATSVLAQIAASLRKRAMAARS